MWGDSARERFQASVQIWTSLVVQHCMRHLAGKRLQSADTLNCLPITGRLSDV